MNEGAPKVEKEFNPYEKIKPIEALGAFTYNATEDEVSTSRAKFSGIRNQIRALLEEFKKEEEKADLPSGYVMSNEFRDAKSYLEGRLNAVDSVLEENRQI